MAEIVQQVLESSIQELSVLEKYNLFDASEIKTVLKKRREFEYRLRKVKKSKDDFLRYISYEESLLKLIRIRREKSGLEIDRNEVEKSILDHIKKLFEFTTNKFKSDIPLWLSYINFCKNQNHLDHVSIIYFRLLQIHNKDWLWLQFAKFEFEEKASSETARKVFLRAINFHSDSKQVWHEYFRFELLYCSKIRKRYSILTHSAAKSEGDDELSEKQSHDAIWNGQLAFIVYKHAINAFADFDFAASFIDICNKLDCETIKEVKQSILDDLKCRFGTCEEYWNVLARDKLCTYEQKIHFGGSGIVDEEQLKLKQESLAEVISTYETACMNFDNAKMWSYYITFRLEDLKSTIDTSARAHKMSEIIFTLGKLWKDDKVTYDIFVEWIMLMYLCNKKDSNIIQKIHHLLKEASDRWPTNLKAHLFFACIMVKLPDKKIADSVIEKFFQDCLSRKFTQVNRENVDAMMDFWQLYLDWSVQNKFSYHKILKMVTQLNATCTYAPRKMPDYFKSKVLAIIFHQFGVGKARSHYQKNKTVSPICKSFSYKMMEIEKHSEEMQEEKSDQFRSRISSIYDDLLHHFGSDDVCIWLDYIRHVMVADATKVGALYEKALKSLKPGECQQFVQQYSLLKTSPSMECEFVSA